MNSFRSAILSGKGLHPADPVIRKKREPSAEPDSLSSVEVPRQESRTHNQRDDDRHRLDQETATARFGGETFAVDLINLSGGGAMIRAPFTPRLWDRVDLIFQQGPELECAVRWLRGDRVGLEFAHETRIDCDPGARDALLLDVIRRSFPDLNLASRPEPETGAPETGTDDDDSVTNSRRTERRHPLVWMGEVLYNHGSERIRLRNISEKGALIEGPFAYPKGAELLLDLGAAGQHFATAGWSAGDKTGLVFSKPFDLKLLGSSKPEIARDLWTRPGPSRQSADQKNPWSDNWRHPSLEQLRDDLEGYLKR